MPVFYAESNRYRIPVITPSKRDGGDWRLQLHELVNPNNRAEVAYVDDWSHEAPLTHATIVGDLREWIVRHCKEEDVEQIWWSLTALLGQLSDFDPLSLESIIADQFRGR